MQRSRASTLAALLWASLPAAGFELPPAGEFMRRAGTKLESSNDLLAGISRELIGTQSEVDETEKSMLGSLMDFGTAKTLYAQHELVAAANAKARADLKRESEARIGLTSELAALQKRFLTSEEDQREAEEHLRSQVAANRLDALRLEANLTAFHNVSENRDTLTKAERELLEEGKRLEAEGERAFDELARVRVALEKEIAKEQKLENDIKVLHKFDVDCHERALHADKVVLLAEKEEPMENAAAKLAAEQALQTAGAGVQRLLAEGGLIKAEILRHEGKVSASLATMKEIGKEIANVTAEEEREVAAIRAQMARTREDIGTVEGKLSEVGATTPQIRESYDLISREAAALHQQLSPQLYIALASENDALQRRFDEATSMLQQANVLKADLATEALQAAADVEAQRKAVVVGNEAAAKAVEEGEKQLQIALETMAESKKKAEVEITVAEESIEQKCAKKWKKRDEEKQKELDRCAQMRQELAVAAAQADALKTTIGSQAAAT